MADSIPVEIDHVEVDHVFVSASVGAPEGERLIDLGLLEGSPNRHPGQGTANRRFFFANAMLELVWVEDAAEAQSEAEPARALHLWERWAGRDGAACPFGVCLRPTAGTSEVAPFPSWEYRPAYSPVGMPVASNSTVDTEPLLFYIPMHRFSMPRVRCSSSVSMASAKGGAPICVRSCR